MANPTNFGQTLLLLADRIVQLQRELVTANDRIAKDATLIAATKVALAGPRPDLTEQDLINFNSALTQLIFTFNSGAPTQSTYIYKLL